MPNRWQREFTCTLCGDRTTALGGEMRMKGLYTWGLQWGFCKPCIEMLREYMFTRTYASIERWRREHPWALE